MFWTLALVGVSRIRDAVLRYICAGSVAPSVLREVESREIELGSDTEEAYSTLRVLRKSIKVELPACHTPPL